jgi:phage-related protein (TIGR01555 family)
MISKIARTVKELLFKNNRVEQPGQKASQEPIDPLAQIISMRKATLEGSGMALRSVEDFPMVEDYLKVQVLQDGQESIAMDSVALEKVAMDDCGSGCAGPGLPFSGENQYTSNPLLQGWYVSQSFIGYQSCAIIAQHWLVNKACSMPGEDAVRNGWEINVADDVKLSEDQLNKIKKFDKDLNVKHHLSEFVRFTNIFGIRVVLFHVESDDPKYYEKPFNADGVRKGSYKGIRQIDPYWMMPMLSAESTSDPTSMHFYDPEFWIISGRRYHRSHLVIGRGPEVADYLKPTYSFGGIPLTQRIYERIYAAERTANEAPLIAMDKRMTVLQVDTKKVALNQSDFMNRIQNWIMFKDNHAVKVLGTNESAMQFDTNLADFDSVIMSQYQLVSAISKVPATKLLGTSPKGFNATGEFEAKSYTQELESIQENLCTPLLQRHHLLALRSMGLDVETEIVWNPTDSPTMAELADLNAKKISASVELINSGQISPDEGRNRLKVDKNSGYVLLSDDNANENIGMSPENIAAFEKAASEETKASAATGTAEAHQTTAGAQVEKVQGEEKDGLALGATAGKEPSEPPPPAGNANEHAATIALNSLAEALSSIAGYLMPEGKVHGGDLDSRSVKNGIGRGVSPSIAGIKDHVGPMDVTKLPKMKLNGRVIVIENPKGSIRSGQNLDGTSWRSKMDHHYGYIRGVEGADGDDLDCFIGPDLASPNTFVINQKDPNTKEFDEHKCMIGFKSQEDAVNAYRAAYSDDWEGFDSCVPMTNDQFQQWICNSPLEEKCIGQTQSFPQTDKATK